MVTLNNNVEYIGTPCGASIEEYLDEQKKQSKNTAVNYRADFRRFLKEALNTKIKHVTVEQLDRVDYSMLLNHRTVLGETVSNSTINRHMATVASILTHLKSTSIINVDLTFLGAIKKLPTRTVGIEHMPMEIVEKYIDEARHEVNYGEMKQNVMIIAVECALRLNEVLELEIGQFTVEGDTVTLKGYGKGNKEYYDKISIDVYNRIIKTMITDESNPKSKLFHPLNTKNITDMMSRIKRNLGYDNREYSFHSFKKTGVTNAYRVSGGDILEAQRKGRHTSLDTTREYLKAEDYGITGIYSLQTQDTELYKKVSHDELLEGIKSLGKGYLHLLNAKINENMQ